MISDQTFEGRRENLSQANKLSRSFAVLLEALNRHRGKGQQKVTVEHATVNAGGVAMLILVFAQSPDAHADAGSLIAPTQVDFSRNDSPITAARQVWWKPPP